MRFTKSSLVTKILIVVLVIYAAVTLLQLNTQLQEKNAEADVLSGQLTVLEQENQRLEQAIENVDTDEGVEAVAREKLGLVKKNETVFYDVGN
jgi:cell division protein FtsB